MMVVNPLSSAVLLLFLSILTALRGPFRTSLSQLVMELKPPNLNQCVSWDRSAKENNVECKINSINFFYRKNILKFPKKTLLNLF